MNNTDVLYFSIISPCQWAKILSTYFHVQYTSKCELI